MGVALLPRQPVLQIGHDQLPDAHVVESVEPERRSQGVLQPGHIPQLGTEVALQDAGHHLAVSEAFTVDQPSRDVVQRVGVHVLGQAVDDEFG